MNTAHQADPGAAYEATTSRILVTDRHWQKFATDHLPGGRAGAASPGAGAADTIARLDALAAELGTHGWTARLHTPRGRPPRLHARNPEPGAAALSEHIYAQPRPDGTWMYWWPWAEPIAETAPDTAAIITRVLRPAGTP